MVLINREGVQSRGKFPCEKVGGTCSLSRKDENYMFFHKTPRKEARIKSRTKY